MEFFLKFELTVGKNCNLAHLRTFLDNAGYLETAKVLDVGDYSIRGGIVDIFPPMNSVPVRFDLFGDLIENARTFAIEDQKSLAAITGSTLLLPVREVSLEQESIALFRVLLTDNQTICF